MSFWEAILAAFVWWLEGLLGCMAAAARVHSDVPTLQCLVSGLSLAAFGFGIDFLIIRAKKRRQRRQWEKEQSYDETDR